MIKSTLNLDFIIKRRKELGFTQKDMALKLGMNSAPAYNKYEKGVYEFNANIIPALSGVLNCDITDIFLPIQLTK